MSWFFHVNKMTSCIVFFILGFLTDKLRLFPLVMGLVLGVLLKSMLDESVLTSIKDQVSTMIFRVGTTS